MTEFSTSILIMLSEAAFFLFAVLSAIVYVYKKRQMKDKVLAKALVEKLKNAEPERKKNILSMLKEIHGFEEEPAEDKAVSLLGHEKKLYSNVLNVFLGRDREKILDIDKHVNRLINSYQDLNSDVEDDSDTGEGEEKTSKVVVLREENKKLREANLSLKNDLEAAMQAMESMTSEYASMYEGGKKEGEQRFKNEMFKLKQTLEKRKEAHEIEEEAEDDPTGGEVIDLDSQEDTQDIPELKDEVKKE